MTSAKLQGPCTARSRRRTKARLKTRKVFRYIGDPRKVSRHSPMPTPSLLIPHHSSHNGAKTPTHASLADTTTQQYLLPPSQVLTFFAYPPPPQSKMPPHDLETHT